MKKALKLYLSVQVQVFLRFMGIPGENANGVFSANEYLDKKQS